MFFPQTQFSFQNDMYRVFHKNQVKKHQELQRRAPLFLPKFLKSTKMLLVVQNFNIALKKAVLAISFW